MATHTFLFEADSYRGIVIPIFGYHYAQKPVLRWVSFCSVPDSAFTFYVILVILQIVNIYLYSILHLYITMTRYQFAAILNREDPYYVARCAELGVVSQGGTVESALANLREAVELYYVEDIPQRKGERLWQKTA